MNSSNSFLMANSFLKYNWLIREGMDIKENERLSSYPNAG
jgi:hypothetical protein